jgi:hypothetical protein
MEEGKGMEEGEGGIEEVEKIGRKKKVRKAGAFTHSPLLVTRSE